jgi:hypothetical protein
VSDENTPMWKLFGHQEGPGQFIRTLRDELKISWAQIQILSQDYGALSEHNLTSTEIVRRVRFGLIEVPDKGEAREELKRRKNKRAAAKRKQTIAREKKEATEAMAKVVPFKPREE